jgi:hypothetical protein
MRTPYRREIEAFALKHALSADLLEAQVVVESGGNPWAWNPEPRYRYLWNVRSQRPFRQPTDFELMSETPPNDFPCLAGDCDQEWWGQQASWGLMQVMGALAREYGFKGPYLTQLCDVNVNLDIATAYLSRLSRWANGDATKMLAAFNAGQGGWTTPAGQRYAAKVIASQQV